MNGEAHERVALIHLLDVAVRVGGPAAALEAANRVFPDTPRWTQEPPAATVDLRVERDDAGGERYRLVGNGEPLGVADGPTQLPRLLEWAVTSSAVARLVERYLLFHAAALHWEGQGWMLPAGSGSGKTTLCAALLAAGFTYLSDEVAAIPIGTCQLVPFAKSLTLKPGSLGPLAAHAPGLGVERAWRAGEPVGYLTPPAGSWPAGPVPLRAIIFPRFVAGAPTALVRVARAEALGLALEQMLSAAALGARAVEEAVALVQRADCYRLVVGDLGEAVDALRALAAGEGRAVEPAG